MAKNKFILALVCILWLMPVSAQSDTWTLRQKVAQMFVFSFYGETLNDTSRAVIERWQPGAVVLLPSNLSNPQQITRLTNDIQQTLLDTGSIPAFIAVDQEGGIIAHLENGFTRWAVPMLLTATHDPDLAFQFGQAVADEMQAVGINMNLAPVADLLTNRDNPIIGRRSYGSDPQAVADTVSNVVRGMQSRSVLATAKHFPGHGDTDSDSHLQLPVIPDSRQALLDRELVPFQATIAADVAAVMTAHIYFPALDTEANLPASLSENIIHDLLRDEMAYNGLVITDALDMDAIDTVYSPAEAAVRAVKAGNDLILLGAHVSPANYEAAMQAVYDAVQDGTISAARIDESFNRIMQAKSAYGIVDWQPLAASSAAQRINLEAHAALLENIFAAGITLAYDNAALLPATDDVVFIFPASRQSLWQVCRHEGWRGLGVTEYPSSQEIQSATYLAQNADTVIVITQNAETNPQIQALVAAMPLHRTLVVALWSPYDRLYLPQTAGYLVTYSPLRAANRPLCAILQGEQSVLGALPIALE